MSNKLGNKNKDTVKTKDELEFLEDDLFDIELEDTLSEKIEKSPITDKKGSDDDSNDDTKKREKEQEILKNKIFNKLEIEDLLKPEKEKDSIDNISPSKDTNENEKLNSDGFKYLFIVMSVLVLIGFLLLKCCDIDRKYAIKFDTNGGNNIVEQKVTKNATVKEPPTPIRIGYKFIGWYVDDKEYDFNSKITKDLILEARWEKIEDIRVTAITLDQQEVTIKVGSKIQLQATITPENAKEKSVTWSSSNSSVASVDENGVVIGKKKGIAIITAITKEGNLKTEATVIVSDISVSNVSLDKKSLNLSVGDKYTLKAIVKPSNAANKNVTWSSSNPKVATINNKGVITALTSGDTIITAKTIDGGKKANIKVHVANISVKEIILNKKNISLNIGNKETLIAKIMPNNSTIKNVTWKSSNTKVATVSASGTITAIGTGTATITVTTVDGNKSATCHVTVNKPTITIKEVSGKVYVGDTINLTAIVVPTSLPVKWSSSKTSVGTIDIYGKFKAISAGKTIITGLVKSNSVEIKSTLDITVNNRVVINMKRSGQDSNYPYIVDSIYLKGSALKLTYKDIIIMIAGDSFQNHVVNQKNEKLNFDARMCNTGIGKTLIYQNNKYTDVTVNC